MAEHRETGTGLRIEGGLGPTMRLGREGHHASSVMAALRAELAAEMGYCALVNPSGGSQHVEEWLATDASAAARRGP